MDNRHPDHPEAIFHAQASMIESLMKGRIRCGVIGQTISSGGREQDRSQTIVAHGVEGGPTRELLEIHYRPDAEPYPVRVADVVDTRDEDGRALAREVARKLETPADLQTYLDAFMGRDHVRALLDELAAARPQGRG